MSAILNGTKEIKTRYLILTVISFWAVLAIVFKGVGNLELATYQNTWATSAAGDAAASIRGNRTKSAAFIYFFNPIRVFVNGFVELIRMTIATPAPNSIIPILGWLGVIGVIAFFVFLTSNFKTTILAVSLLLGGGFVGMWT